MESAKVFGQGAKVGESDKLNIDSIIARLLEGKRKSLNGMFGGVGGGADAVGPICRCKKGEQRKWRR